MKVTVEFLEDEADVVLDALKQREIYAAGHIARREGDRAEHELILGKISYIRQRIIDAQVKLAVEKPKIKLAIIGPNLNDQTKGTFHVHTADCNDRRHYGPGKRFGSEDNGWVVEVGTVREVVYAIYADHLDEGYPAEKQDETADEWANDFWFAPCVPKDLPVS